MTPRLNFHPAAISGEAWLQRWHARSAAAIILASVPQPIRTVTPPISTSMPPEVGAIPRIIRRSHLHADRDGNVVSTMARRELRSFASKPIPVSDVRNDRSRGTASLQRPAPCNPRGTDAADQSPQSLPVGELPSPPAQAYGQVQTQADLRFRHQHSPPSAGVIKDGVTTAPTIEPSDLVAVFQIGGTKAAVRSPPD